jgi:hypothetical protein
LGEADEYNDQSEMSLYEAPANVVKLNCILLSGDKWRIWLNNMEISSDQNSTVRICGQTIRITEVTAQYVKFTHGEREIQLYPRQTFNLSENDFEPGSYSSPVSVTVSDPVSDPASAPVSTPVSTPISAPVSATVSTTAGDAADGTVADANSAAVASTASIAESKATPAGLEE